MPLPSWIGQVNKHVFNKRELRKGERPVLRHVGRSSAKTYHTPLDAHPVDSGYMFILMYGASSDWVRNVLAAGKATLEIGGEEQQLGSPRLVGEDEAWPLMDPDTKRPPTFLNVTEFLRMDSAG